MKRTKKLTASEYGSYKIYNREEGLRKLVNKEAEVWHSNDPRPEIPQFTIPKIPKSVGLWNTLRQVLP